jgi:hypothetical protein
VTLRGKTLKALDFRRDIDMWQPLRYRRQPERLRCMMCADAIVLTDVCAPVQQDSIEHRGASLGGIN